MLSIFLRVAGVLISLALPLILSAQLTGNAISNALGGISLFQSNALSTVNQPSNLSLIEESQVGINLHNHFGLEELNNSQIGLAIKGKSADYGFHMDHIGFEEFRDTKMSLALAKKIHNQTSIGLMTQYQTLTFETSNRQSINVMMSMTTTINESWTFAMNYFHPSTIRIHALEKTSPSPIIKAGLSYNIDSTATLFSEIQQVIEKDMDFKVGLEYLPYSHLILRFGFGTVSQHIGAGIAYRLKPMDIHFTTSFHRHLGLSPSLLAVIPL